MKKILKSILLIFLSLATVLSCTACTGNMTYQPTEELYIDSPAGIHIMQCTPNWGDEHENVNLSTNLSAVSWFTYRYSTA